MPAARGGRSGGCALVVQCQRPWGRAGVQRRCVRAPRLRSTARARAAHTARRPRGGAFGARRRRTGPLWLLVRRATERGAHWPPGARVRASCGIRCRTRMRGVRAQRGAPTCTGRPAALAFVTRICCWAQVAFRLPAHGSGEVVTPPPRSRWQRLCARVTARIRWPPGGRGRLRAGRRCGAALHPPSDGRGADGECGEVAGFQAVDAMDLRFQG
jgi:hypothetical protein